MVLDHAYGGANFEHVVHAFESMESLCLAWESGHGVIEGVLSGGPRGSLSRLCEDHQWRHLGVDAVLETIHTEIIAASQSVSSHHDWTAFRDLLRQLEADFDLHIITLNYDDLVEQALSWGANEQGFTSVSGGLSRFTAYGRPPRFLHLHGSVFLGASPKQTHAGEIDNNWHELYMYPTITDARQSWPVAQSHPVSQSLRHTICGPLITGMQKADKLQIEPYATLGRHAGNLLAEHPRLLIAGYGFGDLHINGLINKMHRVHGNTRRVALIDHTPELGEAWRGMAATWVKRRRSLQEALCLLTQDGEPLDPLGPVGGYDVVDRWISKDARCCVHLCGLNHAAKHHASQLSSFLAK